MRNFHKRITDRYTYTAEFGISSTFCVRRLFALATVVTEFCGGFFIFRKITFLILFLDSQLPLYVTEWIVIGIGTRYLCHRYLCFANRHNTLANCLNVQINI